MSQITKQRKHQWERQKDMFLQIDARDSDTMVAYNAEYCADDPAELMVWVHTGSSQKKSVASLERILFAAKNHWDDLTGGEAIIAELPEPPEVCLLQKPKVEPDNPYAGVWKVYDYLDEFYVGYLVTEPGNLDRPYAYVNSGCCSEDVAMAIVMMIVKDPNEVWRKTHDEMTAIDIHKDGCAGVHVPMPAFVYGLRCRPLDANGKVIDVPAREPRPYCRFLFSQLSNAGITWHGEKGAAHK